MLALSLTVSKIRPVFHQKRTFFYILHSAANLKMFSLYCITQYLYTESRDKELIIRVKTFF